MKNPEYNLAIGQEVEINGTGDAVALQSADGDIEVIIPGQGSVRLSPGESHKITRGQFKTVSIKNLHGSANSVRVLVGYIQWVSAKLTGAVNAQPVTSGELVSLADAVVTNATKLVIANANADRRELHIHNPAGGGSLRIGDTNITASRGIELLAGQTLILATGAQVSARNDSGASITISLLEVNH